MDQLRQWRESLPPGENTLDAAGARLGVTGVQMYRYERGLRRVPPEKVKAVAKITKIKPSILRPDIFGRARKIKPRTKAIQQAG